MSASCEPDDLSILLFYTPADHPYYRSFIYPLGSPDLLLRAWPFYSSRPATRACMATTGPAILLSHTLWPHYYYYKDTLIPFISLFFVGAEKNVVFYSGNTIEVRSWARVSRVLLAGPQAKGSWFWGKRQRQRWRAAVVLALPREVKIPAHKTLLACVQRVATRSLERADVAREPHATPIDRATCGQRVLDEQRVGSGAQRRTVEARGPRRGQAAARRDDDEGRTRRDGVGAARGGTRLVDGGGTCARHAQRGRDGVQLQLLAACAASIAGIRATAASIAARRPSRRAPMALGAAGAAMRARARARERDHTPARSRSSSCRLKLQE